MKNLLRLSLITVSFMTGVPGSYAAPFLAIGDGAELFLTGNLGVRADDNIYLSTNAESDLIFDVEPGVELTFGKNAQLSGSLALVERFANYSDNSSLNSNLFSGAFISKFDDGKLKLGLTVRFDELNQNLFNIRPTLAGIARGFVRRDVFSVLTTTEVEVSQITSVAAAIQFDQENFKQFGFTDSDNLTVPLNVFYRWTPKTDVSLGYRYRDTRVDLGEDSTDHFFNVGARGEFTPKLTGRFAVGINTRKLQAGGDETQLGLDASFKYEISPKTNLELSAANDFGTGPRGQQEKNLMLGALLTAKVSEEWSVNGGIRWRAIDYGSRTDDYAEGQVGTAYIVNANVRLVGAFTHRDYSSGIRALEFKNNIFSIAANFRY